MDQVYKLHGLLDSIISDGDCIITSVIWQGLFKLTDTHLLMSSSYHPQTDGQTERLNQCLEGFLRCSVHSCPKQWAKWLPLAAFWYNTSYHSSLGKSPFEVLYGHSPRHWHLQWGSNTCTWIRWMAPGKKLAARSDSVLVAPSLASHEDMVYLKLQLYIQTSVAPRSNQKLSFKFYGPFKVLARVGNVAYHLQLLDECHIHPVVQISAETSHFSICSSGRWHYGSSIGPRAGGIASSLSGISNGSERQICPVSN